MTDKDVSSLTDTELAAMMVEDAPAPEPAAEAAPEPVAEVAPEPTAEAAPEADEPQHPEGKRRMIDDLREERSRRKEMAARMEEMERRFAEYQQRTVEYLASMQAAPPGQAVPPPPDFDSDPIEYLRHQQGEVAKNLEAIKAQQMALEQRRQAETQWAAMREAVGRAEQEFVRSKPDYYEAVQHLRAGRRSQLEQQGAAPHQIDQLLQADAVALATEASRLGLSPAEYAYRVAVGYGWQPKPVATAVAPAEAAPRSLGAAAGRQDDATPSLADIAKMSDADFDKIFAKVMGGS